MDRKAWIAITLSVIGLFAWQWYVSTQYPPVPPPPVSATPAPGAPDAPTPPVVAATPLPQPESAPAPTPRVPVMAPMAETLSDGTADFVFNNDAGGIEKVMLKLHLGENDSPVTLNRDRALPIGALGFQPGEVSGGFEMTSDRGAQQVRFKKAFADGLVVEKVFTVPPNTDLAQRYRVKMQLRFTNPGSADLNVPPFYVSTGGAAPIHNTDLPLYTRFDWSHEGKMDYIDVNWFSASSVPLLGIPLRGERPLYNEMRTGVEWAAVTSQYFCTIVSATDPKGTGVWARRFLVQSPGHGQIFGIQGALGLSGFSVPPGTTVTRDLEIYAGPKELDRLKTLGQGQDHVMNFGMFGWVSEFLLWGMNSLHSVLGSYAWAIIVLTLIIKTLLWPVQNKATREMRKMAALSPMMTQMREKYKDDPQKMNEELMKLYKEYGVNPFSGCLPMLIQIPIFFGFYSMLGVAIELRNSSFLWVADLSQPDTVTHLLGFPINVLPIVMAGTMIWQIVITPKTGDATQQRIMYFMPVIFLVFAYNYASGLALYWTTQNIFSIVQLYLTRNQPLPQLEKRSDIARKAAEAQKKLKKKKKP